MAEADNSYYWNRVKYDDWINHNYPENEEMDILDLRGSELTELSENINRFKNLYILSLDNNKLTELPDSFLGLDKLEEITLDNNNLQTLPDSIFQLHNLQTLSLKGNVNLRLPPQYRARVEELNPPNTPHSFTSHMTPEEIDNIFSRPNVTGGFRKSRKSRKFRRTRKSRKYKRSKRRK